MSKKVLIVDDEPNIVTSLEFLMEANGFEVLIARNGEEALQAASIHRPDLILLDVMLPVKNGFEVCQKLRESADLSAIKILMLTAKGRDIEIAKGKAVGADDYITKPFSTQELVERVRRLLE
ncbi:MAG: response regulator transcription factor [Burkholderiales bacterium]